jgi:hypothetical protein
MVPEVEATLCAKQDVCSKNSIVELLQRRVGGVELEKPERGLKHALKTLFNLRNPFLYMTSSEFWFLI